MFRHSKKMRHQNAAKKKYQLKLEEIRSLFAIHFKKRFIFSERRKLFFGLEAKSVFVLLGAPLSTFGSKGLHPEIDFWVNSVNFAVHQPKQKAKKNHMQISYVVLLYTCHHSIFGEKKLANQNKSNPIRPENSPLLAGTENGRCPYCPGILFRVFRKFYVHHKAHPEVVTRAARFTWNFPPLPSSPRSQQRSRYPWHAESERHTWAAPTFGRHKNLPVGYFIGND